mmetsp:Transcript_79398/g.233275  ORF Transcript_79398/g.233275 Transcript_79398/m.233275 type:complete len:135 (+) Transcript_79398:93-497(+)
MPTTAAKTAVLFLLLLQATPARAVRQPDLEGGEPTGSLAETEGSCGKGFDYKCCCVLFGETWTAPGPNPIKTAQLMGSVNCAEQAKAKFSENPLEPVTPDKIEKVCLDARDGVRINCCERCATEHGQTAWPDSC